MIIKNFIEKQQRVMLGIRQLDLDAKEVAASVLLEAAQRSNYIYFDASTMAMLRDKYQHYDEVIAQVTEILEGTLPEQLSSKLIQQASTASFPGGFIWFSEPLHKESTIGALFFWHIQDRHGVDLYQLLVITNEGDVEYLMEAELGEAWHYIAPIHQCRRCSIQDGQVIPCHVCGTILAYWSEILVLSTIIAGQYLAAKKYGEKTITMKHPQPKRGKKPPRPVEYQIKTIHADEIFIAVPTEEYIAHHPPGTAGSSWVEAALEEGDLEYVKVTTRSFERIYHTKDRGDITYTFTKGVEQNRPMRKSYAGRRISKVTAPSYEAQKEEGKHE